MCRLFQFLIIDEFTYKRDGSIYFLSHWHSDHYQGICNNWPYGPIYCSPITMKFLKLKYAKITNKLMQLQYDQVNDVNSIVINKFGIEEEVKFKVRIFDSNHMAGSIMMLIQYKQKYYLHTGDMRFNEKVAENNQLLFRKIVNHAKNNKTQIYYECNYKIQQLFLDNTFCDPIFMFPPRSFALKLITTIISTYKPSKLFLCTDSIGKQQAFIYLSKKYSTLIKVNRDRWNYIKCMGIQYKNYFTLSNTSDTWIQVIRKVDKDNHITQHKNSIAITLTGWANLNDYHPVGYNSFVVPYSLHSNYKQIQMFIKWIKPKKIIPIVNHNDEKKGDQFRQKIGSYEGYMFSLCYVKQRGLEYLKKKYEVKDNNQQQKKQKKCQQTVYEIQI